jgi:hypothetical protein
MNGHLFRLAIVMVELAAVGPVAAQRFETEAARDPVPRVVSPWAEGSVPETSTSCPTFLWAGVDDIDEYELRVYRVAREWLVVEQNPLIDVEVPGGATGWTSPGARCLEPGVYSWVVRGRTGGTSTAWSEAGWFEVPKRPTADDVARALDILERHRDFAEAETAGATATSLATAAAPAPRAREAGAPEAAVRERVATTTVGTSLRVGPPGSTTRLSILQVDGEIRGNSGSSISVNASSYFQDATFDDVILNNGSIGNVAVTNLEILGSVEYQGGDVRKDGGGAGFFSIPSATFLDVDDNTHVCAGGGLVRGLKLIAQPSDQLAFELICTD